MKALKNIFIYVISILNKLKFILNPNIKLGKNVICSKLTIKGPGKVIIEDNCNLWSFAEKCELYTYSKEATIHIKENTRINGATIQARKNITIGKDCRIGSALIMDNDFHNSSPEKRHSKSEIPTKPVEIGNNVWLCGRTIILKGVKVGENSVVGIGSVVPKSIPANKVAAGNPARIVKDLS